MKIRLRPQITVFILLLMHVITYAQTKDNFTISGKIVDAETKEMVAFANVLLYLSNDSANNKV